MPEAQVLKLRLSLMGRPVRNYAFEKPVVSVGRDPAADVFVDNPGVSRDHFRFERVGGGEYQVVDLGSANGTFVNDQMVNTAVVHDNDVVRFGKYTLWVGYEVDRRSTPRGEPVTTAVSDGAGHTVVLSRAEIGTILEQEKRKASVPTGPGAAGAKARAKGIRNLWLAFATGIVLGLAGGASWMWWYAQRQP